ncbi:N-acetyl-gamma-glutamyl-phosphate reductase [Maridesulfovibrio salexigens]|uniref:N-acetyl-gamma-glutamyl-phosphate reductase n=1 Tax=Maridesulfovibrio salexigens (strain ATCC 14822 / DSM 2638 / NCIMB 8403 / VKM B-1763) TaxID=526222 RepID=C6C0R4_MARSD|nr:N-acetyl-gamma-glutamyl-phosphate reductase [Maridesulfovibrio salexigens]ACS81011.1 N-acetyl-gamma-glutamyl-phosphate reductase [Maridesulfovibrio salexigens DSM 2638]
MSAVPVGLVGVTGYTGMELTRILSNHDGMKLVRVTSRAEAGKKLADIYPFLNGMELGGLEITAPEVEDLAEACDLVFLAVPHKTAMNIGGQLYDKGIKVVDLSADFRIRDRETYEAWYKVDHTREDLLPEAVYGLPEFYRDQVKGAKLVANPGCYPTSVIVGLTPALREGLVETSDIVIDSKSGTSGAGRKAAVGTLFCEVADSFRAYGLTTHRHTPEIEQELAVASGEDMTVSFNTHLLPIDRGILSTIYTKLKPGVTAADIRAAYEKAYGNEKMIRFLSEGQLPETRWVRGTMFCDVAVVPDERTGRLIILAAIDNLCRGASGQAVANANLMLGFEETKGLSLAPMMP